jgi:hypothetical protein
MGIEHCISDLYDVAKGVVRAAARGRLAVVSQTKPVRHLVPETVVTQRAALNTGIFFYLYIFKPYRITAALSMQLNLSSPPTEPKVTGLLHLLSSTSF